MDVLSHATGNAGHTDPEPASLPDGVELLRRCRVLKSEIDQFAAHLSVVYRDYFQQFPTQMHVSLANSVRTEIEYLERSVNSDDPMAAHRVSSSNLPFLQTVWDTAKAARGIVKLRHPVFNGPSKSKTTLAPGVRIIITHGSSEPLRNGSFIVDVMSDSGRSWYKVSSMTNKRLLYDMAKEAVYCGDSDDEEEDGDGGPSDEQDLTDLPLVKLARNLVESAQGHRIQTRSPVPHLVLPRIIEGEHAEIDRIINACRAMGVEVLCGDALPPAPQMSEALLYAMAPGPKASITRTLNIDTSILVGLASDFSHSKVDKQPWFSHSHNDHADLETKEAWVPPLFKLLANHDLVCTKEAAEAFSHIVNTIATDAESARASIILNVDAAKTPEMRVNELRLLSIHAVPLDLHLPIRIVDSTESGDQTLLPAQFQDKLKTLLNPGRSVFSYGWAKGLTTVTSNAVAVKQLEKSLESLDSMDMPWPLIWPLASSRPLVGIPKNGAIKKKIRKHIGDCSTVCTCGVEELYGGRSDVTII
ncbi:hypothetical protein F5Y15DRAFT_191666 [Xylariaceae sp. FL0016]|nr:hypothetical protein F5Y15DRAFT_191666 [Xylariaceae sp. FL0016]